MNSLKLIHLITDETRSRLIGLLLEHPYCVKALSKKMGISEPAVSQQMKLLKQNGLVEGVRLGYQVHYRVDRDPILSAVSELSQAMSGQPSMMLVQSVVNGFGSEALAGFSAAMRIESMCIVPMTGIGNAVSSYTAQNIGAGKKGRVVSGYHAANIMVVTCAAIICLIGFKMAVDGLLRGAGDMKMFTVANLVNLTIRVVISMTLAPRFGIAFVWYAVPAGWFANWIISFAQYRTGKWRLR